MCELTLLTVDRADDDHPAELAFPHAGPDRVHGVEHAGQVGVDHLMPLFGRHLVERRVAGDASVGDNHVDRAQIRLNLGDARGRFVIIADVPFVGLDTGFGGEGGGSFVVAGIGGGDVVSVCFQFLGNGRADAARTPGDECNFSHDILQSGKSCW